MDIAQLITRGNEHLVRAEYKIARECFEQALGTLNQESSESPESATVRVALAEVLSRQGENLRATELVEEALAIGEVLFGQDHPWTLNTLLLFGMILGRFGDHLAAIEIFKRAHRSLEKTLGAEHPKTLQALRLLGVALFEQEKFAEAGETLKRALDLCIRSLGPEHPETKKTELHYIRFQGTQQTLTSILFSEFERHKILCKRSNCNTTEGESGPGGNDQV